MKRVLSVLLIIFACHMAVAPCMAQAQLSWFLGNPMVGEKAKDFTLKDLSGNMVSLEGLRNNQKAIVFFWATWCPHCRSQLKELNQRKSELQDKGIQTILVDIGENSNKVKTFLNRSNMDFNVLLDLKTKVATDYDIAGVPTYIFINQKGIIQAVEHVLPDDYEEILTQE